MRANPPFPLPARVCNVTQAHAWHDFCKGAVSRAAHIHVYMHTHIHIQTSTHKLAHRHTHARRDAGVMRQLVPMFRYTYLPLYTYL